MQKKSVQKPWYCIAITPRNFHQRWSQVNRLLLLIIIIIVLFKVIISKAFNKSIIINELKGSNGIECQKQKTIPAKET
jgi:cell division protein FtsI/penicillin-binding protein 2